MDGRITGMLATCLVSLALLSSCDNKSDEMLYLLAGQSAEGTADLDESGGEDAAELEAKDAADFDVKDTAYTRECTADVCGTDSRGDNGPDAREVVDTVTEKDNLDVLDDCTPDCAGRACGDNGCGGTCGSCWGGETCDATGHCECDHALAESGFRRICAGSFWMGSPGGEDCPPGYTGGGCSGAGTGNTTPEPGNPYFEDPWSTRGETLHKVNVTSYFEIMDHEVTQGEWRAVAQVQGWVVEPSYFSTCGNGDDCPVERVNWYEALEYANAMSRAATLEECYAFSVCTGTIGGGCGSYSSCYADEALSVVYRCYVATLKYGKPQQCKGYRLPTESEWEYAYRATKSTAFYNGDIQETSCSPVDPNLAQVGWYCGNASNTTHVTGKSGGKIANDWGLYDMTGNVQEWCADGGLDDWGPNERTDPYSSDSTTGFGLRGGDWEDYPIAARAAWRGVSEGSYRASTVGFRLVRSVP